MSWLRPKWRLGSTIKEDQEDRRTSVTELSDGAVKNISERSQADQSGTNEGEAVRGEKEKDSKAKGDVDEEKIHIFGRKKATTVPAMSGFQTQDHEDEDQDPKLKGGFTTGPQQGAKVDELAFTQALSMLKDYNIRKVQEIATLQEEVLKSHTEIAKLKEQVSELEIIKSQELKKCSLEISNLNAALLREKEGRASVDTELKKAEEEIVTLKHELEYEARRINEDYMRKMQDMLDAQSALKAEVKHWQAENVDLEEKLKAKNNEVQMEMATKECYTIHTLEEFDERKIIGHGAYGAVYVVRMNGTPCIAKRVHDILVGQRGNAQVGRREIEAVRSKFQAECQLLGKLKHPNIVQFLGIYHDGDDDVLVMEYMPMDLAKCLDTCSEQQFNIPLPIKLSILQDVTNGLLHLHSLAPPIIHRDLTASNILLTSDMRAKIADLGVSKVFDLQRVQTIQQTKAPGTPAYMPPEALIPEPQYDVQLDIFSFGVLCIYIANQEFPAPHEVLLTESILKQKTVQLTKRQHWIDKMGVDHPLCPIVVQCLQDLPGSRPTIRKLWEDMNFLSTKHKKDWNNTLELIKENEELKAQRRKLEMENVLKTQQAQTYMLKERDDQISANKTAYDYAEELKSLRSQHEETSAELKECKRELELAKEEIAVKVAQVKQYQKQVEAYKQQEDSPVENIIDYLLKLLDRDVLKNCKNCVEYFELFRSYASFHLGCQHLLKKDAFVTMITFLFESTETSDSQQQTSPRHWSTSQMKEFSPLHGTISLLVRNCDISMFESEGDCPQDELPANPYMIPGNKADLQPLSEGMKQLFLDIPYSKRFITECVFSLGQCDSQAVEAIASTFCYCCWNNQSFSALVIQDLQSQIQELPFNELRPYFNLLMDILVINDLLQMKRITFAVHGGKYQPSISIFSTLRVSSGIGSVGEPNRAYQVIKFLVGLANKTTVARDYLLQNCSDWQWAVAWLRKKKSAEYSLPHPSVPSTSRTFQRTSGQDTLEEANTLLNELEACDHGDSKDSH